MPFAWATRSCSSGVRAAAFALAIGLLAAGCQYGYSRSALEAEPDLPPSSRGYASAGSPWYLSFSYTDGYPSYYPYPSAPYYYSPYAAYYDPWWYYPRYAAPWHPYPSPPPVVVTPAPRRAFRPIPPGTPSPKPSGPASPSPSRRRFNSP